MRPGRPLASAPGETSALQLADARLPAQLHPRRPARRPHGLGGAGARGAGLRVDRRRLARGRALRGAGARSSSTPRSAARATSSSGPMAATAALSAAAVADLATGGTDDFVALTIALALVDRRHRARRRPAAAGLPRQLHLRAGAQGLHRRARADDHHRPDPQAVRHPQGRGRLLRAALGLPRAPRRHERPTLAVGLLSLAVVLAPRRWCAGRPGVAGRRPPRDRGRAGLRPRRSTASRSSATIDSGLPLVRPSRTSRSAIPGPRGRLRSA